MIGCRRFWSNSPKDGICIAFVGDKYNLQTHGRWTFLSRSWGNPTLAWSWGGRQSAGSLCSNRSREECVRSRLRDWVQQQLWVQGAWIQGQNSPSRIQEDTKGEVANQQFKKYYIVPHVGRQLLHRSDLYSQKAVDIRETMDYSQQQQRCLTYSEYQISQIKSLSFRSLKTSCDTQGRNFGTSCNMFVLAA